MVSLMMSTPCGAISSRRRYTGRTEYHLDGLRFDAIDRLRTVAPHVLG
ncbi:hypothetical protein KCP77_14655 [Salmonella enterica subsp. enterica]|nr:hypothetical protein KCP77_14655 [Salmonella enterica subsp. enterica]